MFEELNLGERLAKSPDSNLRLGSTFLESRDRISSLVVSITFRGGVGADS